MKLKTGILATIVLLVIARLFFATRVELLPEEAYYWTYWKNPALSYFDHPPMVAWVIGLGTTLCGDTELGVRLGFIALSLGSLALLMTLSRLWFDGRAAWWAALLFSIAPVFVGTGIMAFPDGPLIFFWLLTLVAVSLALKRNQGAWWWLAGIAFGAAMLSKYTAVLLGVSLLAFLIWVPQYRSWLRRPHPWLAALLAAAVFSPVIIWNVQNQWASFLFQSTRTVDQKSNPLWTMLEFWLFQPAALTPPVFALVAWVCGRSIRRCWGERNAADSFAVIFSLPLFCVFVLASFKTEIHINWSAPAFLALLPAAGALLAERVEAVEPLLRRRWRFAIGASVALCLVVLTFGLSSLTWGWPKLLAYSRVGGWRELAGKVEIAERELEQRTGLEAFVLGADKYNLSAELGFYSREPEEQLNVFALGLQGVGYRFWTDLGRWQGHPAIVVLTRTNRVVAEELRAYFEHVDPPVPVTVTTIGRRHRTLYFVNAYGYRTNVTTAAGSIDPSAPSR